MTIPDNYKDFLSNIKLLREEARELKECFNNQCFQAIAIVTTFYILLFKFMVTRNDNQSIIIHWELGLSAYVLIIILISVLKVGIYKFESANKLIGYILHVECKNLENNDCVINKDQDKEHFTSFLINWESMIKAWRIFLPTIEDRMYVRTPSIYWSKLRKISTYIPSKKNCRFFRKLFMYEYNRGKLKRCYKEHDGKKYLWYLPHKLVHSEGKYSPGTYLKRMMIMLHVLGLIGWFFILSGTIALLSSKICFLYKFVSLIMFIIVSLVMLIYMFRRPILMCNRIEKELFCIHSCAIFWKVVSTGHKRALIACGSEKPLKHYSFLLSCLSIHFVNNGIHNAHEWCLQKTTGEMCDYIQNNLLSDYPSKLQKYIIEGLERLRESRV